MFLNFAKKTYVVGTVLLMSTHNMSSSRNKKNVNFLASISLLGK